MQQLSRDQVKDRNFNSALYLCLLLPLLLFGAHGQASTVLAGSGTNACTLQVNFASGTILSFTYRFGSTTIRAQTALEAIITETGGTLLRTGYLTDFSSALSLLSTPPMGLVVHYQSSAEYPDPYINGILWTATGDTNGDYLSDVDWWQIWAQGPAQLEQPYNDPPTPLILTPNSGWVSSPASGIKDILMENGAYLGLVYGSTNAPTFPSNSLTPPPVVKSTRVLSGNQLEMVFETVPNVSYVLKRKSSLLDASWSSVTNLAATSTVSKFTVPMHQPGGQEFFRLEVAP